MSPMPPMPPMTQVKLTLMRDGACRQLERVSLRTGRWRMIDFEATFALIEHPTAGGVLFDTGYTRRFFDETRRFPARLYRMITPVRLHSAPAVGQVKIPVQHVIVSHFHADHIGGLRDFPAAKMHCTQRAWDAVKNLRGLRAVRHGFLPGLVPEDFASRAQFTENHGTRALPIECAPFTEGFDLLGDGSLLAVGLPGHAEGQLGIFLREESGSLTFLLADAAWSRRAIRENVPPARCAGLLGDWTQLVRTIAMLHDLHRRNPHVRLIPSHCPEIWQD